MEETLSACREVVGKWSKGHYLIIKRLGTGGTAEVFLVERKLDNRFFAMKISQDILSLNREYQLLKKFADVDFVVDVHEIDDCIIDGDIYHYILLDYIVGEDLKRYTEKTKLKMITILGIIVIMLRALESFHTAGYILGDLKLENIMFDRGKNQLKLIDLGGVVPSKGTIKEYTPAYDRATWRCGSRKAEESYDLFTLTMILVRLILGENLNPFKETKNEIINKIVNKDIDLTLKKLIINMIETQRYNGSEFAKEINELYNRERHRLIKHKKTMKDRLISSIFKASIGFLILTTIFILFTT